MATVGFAVFVDRVFVEKASGVIYSIVIRMSWIACPYFEGLVFLFFMLDVAGVFLGGPTLGRVIPFLGSDINNRYVGRDVTDIYRLDFLIGIVLNKMALLSVL